MSFRRARWFLAAVALLAMAVAAAPVAVRAYWSARSTNPVRRGVQRAAELGCFACHGPGGGQGIPDPGYEEAEVPAWSGGVWMMYVESDQEIREFILHGVSERRARGLAALESGVQTAISMPAYAKFLRGTDLEDLTAAFKVLSRMSPPPRSSAAGRGYALARRWNCFACHGPGGSGGLHNPGSFAGFIPGWYGADWEDLVRDRAEFDSWVREGSIPRLNRHPVASYFLGRQRIRMPGYPQLGPGDLDDLWAYTVWLAETGGGIAAAD